MTKWLVSQDFTNRMLEMLIGKIGMSGMKFDAVVGIANGGLNISQPIAKALGLPHYSVLISKYHGGEIIKTNQFDSYAFKGGVLVVDDIVDGGWTMKKYKEVCGWKYNDASAALWLKNGCPYCPDFYVFTTNHWIVFPWEQQEQKHEAQMAYTARNQGVLLED